MTPYLRIPLTPAEARKLVNLARKAKRNLSDHIRAVMLLPPRDERRPSRISCRTRRGMWIVAKVHLSSEERAELSVAAASSKMTDRDYVRVLLGLPRLRPTRVRAGAPLGNHNARRKATG